MREYKENKTVYSSLSEADVLGYEDSVGILKGTGTPQVEVAGQSKDSSSGRSGAESPLERAEWLHVRVPVRVVAVACVQVCAAGVILVGTGS